MIYDAAVVGAGPTGLAVARDLAAQGFRVLILEEHLQIGQPLHCSGLVTPRTLALAGVDERLVINQLTGATVHHPQGRRLSMEGGRVHALAIDREGFDREMAAQAEAAGADLWLGAKLVDIQRQGEALRLEVSRRRQLGEAEAQARLLIGADGVHSRVARWLSLDAHDAQPARASGVPTKSQISRGTPSGPSLITPSPRRTPRERVVALGAEARLKLPRQDFVEVFVGQSVAPGFFAWAIPLAEGRARVGIATSDGRRPIHYLKALVETFPQIFAGVEFLRFYGGVIPLEPLPQTYADNILLVGDAAGQTKSTSGGGIYTGLVAAKHCAQVAATALREDDLSAASLVRYQQAWCRELGGELERGRDLRRIFLSLSDRELEHLLVILRSPRLQRLIARHGDIDSPSYLFRRLALARPLLTTFVRVALSFPWR